MESKWCSLPARVSTFKSLLQHSDISSCFHLSHPPPFKVLPKANCFTPLHGRTGPGQWWKCSTSQHCWLSVMGSAAWKALWAPLISRSVVPQHPICPSPVFTRSTLNVKCKEANVYVAHMWSLSQEKKRWLTADLLLLPNLYSSISYLLGQPRQFLNHAESKNVRN